MDSHWSWQQGSPIASIFSSTTSDATATRTWTRRLWGSEVTFAVPSIASPGAMDMLLSVRIHPTSLQAITMEHVRNATRAMRWAHPGIGVTIAFPKFGSLAEVKPEQGRLVYEPPQNEDDINTWLNEMTIDTTSLLDVAKGDFDGALDALQRHARMLSGTTSKWQFRVYVIIHKQSGTYALAIQTGHTVFDGRGTFQVLDLWLHELSKVLDGMASLPYNWGEEAVRLPLAFADRSVILPSGDPTPDNHPMLQNVRQLLMHSSFGVPILREAAHPTYTGAIQKTFPAPFAEQLRRAARTQDCSLCSLFTAASWLTLLHMGEKSSTSEELCASQPSPCDLRSQMVSAEETKTNRGDWRIINAVGANPLIGRSLQRFLKSEDIVSDVWTLAKEIQQQLDSQKHFLPTAVHWLPDVGALFMSLIFGEDLANDAQNPYASAAVSSLGVMDDDLAPSYPASSRNPVLKISKPTVSFAGFVERPSDIGVWVHPYTWQGTLRIAFSWPAAYMGTVEEQLEAEQKGKPNVHAFIQEYVSLLEKLVDKNETRSRYMGETDTSFRVRSHL